VPRRPQRPGKIDGSAHAENPQIYRSTAIAGNRFRNRHFGGLHNRLRISHIPDGGFTKALKAPGRIRIAAAVRMTPKRSAALTSSFFSFSGVKENTLPGED